METVVDAVAFAADGGIRASSPVPRRWLGESCSLRCGGSSGTAFSSAAVVSSG
jgi:hypothetical protein